MTTVRTYRISNETIAINKGLPECARCGRPIRNIVEIDGKMYGSGCAAKVLPTCETVEAPVQAPVVLEKLAAMSIEDLSAAARSGVHFHFLKQDWIAAKIAAAAQFFANGKVPEGWLKNDRAAALDLYQGIVARHSPVAPGVKLVLEARGIL